MGFLYKDNLGHLVEKLSDARNIKITSPKGKTVKEVTDKIVGKIDDVTKAIYQDVENNKYSFKVGTGNDVDISTKIEDGFGSVGIKGEIFQNIITNPSDELILNKEIDEIGTNINIADTKLDSIVDVCCEGLTLNNILTKSSPKDLDKNINTGHIPMVMETKVNTDYTVFINISNINLDNQKDIVVLIRGKLLNGDFVATSIDNSRITTGGILVFKWREPINKFKHLLFGISSSANENNPTFTFKNMMVVEGDFTNKIPPVYFEGIKSVGEVAGGNKINISAIGDNLLNDTGIEYTNQSREFFNTHDLAPVFDKLGLRRYTLSFDIKAVKNGECRVYGQNGSGTKYDIGMPVIQVTTEYKRHTYSFTPQRSRTDDVMALLAFYSNYGSGVFCTVKNIKLQVGDVATAYKRQVFNKKEILLNEPLRGVVGGLKDEFVKVDNKWYIKRNFAKTILTGKDVAYNVDRYMCKEHNAILTRKIDNYTFDTDINIVSKYLPTKAGMAGLWGQHIEEEGISFVNTGWGFCIKLHNSKTGVTQSDTVDEVKLKFTTYLNNNPLEVVYRLNAPTYEPLNISSDLNCYNEFTYVFNDSLIPCSMRVKNTGYAVNTDLIQANTRYTVLGIPTNTKFELCGVKSNINTITTPNEITDYNLRISNVGNFKYKNALLVKGDYSSLTDSSIPNTNIEGIVGIGDVSKNLVDKRKIVYNKWINSVDGITTGDGNERAYLDYTKVIGGRYIILSGCQPTACYEYSDIGVCTVKSTQFSNPNYKLKDDTEYIRFTFNTTKDFSKIQLEYGRVVTKYEEYYDGYKINVISNSKNSFEGCNKLTAKNGSKIIYQNYNECVFEHTKINEGVGIDVVRYYGKKIALSYDITLLDGATINIGGHTRHECLGFYIDGVSVASGYHTGHKISLAKNKRYHIDVIFNVHINSQWFVDGEYICIEPNRYTQDTPTYAKVKVENIQIALSDKVESYESYKETNKVIIVDKPLMLLPNGVRDEITTDGKLIRRVGSVEIDGLNENWKNGGYSNDVFVELYDGVVVENAKIYNNSTYNNNCICAKFPPSINQNEEWAFINGNGKASIRAKKSKVGGDWIYFKNWLKENPFVIYYQLDKPIVTEIDKISLRYFKNGNISFDTKIAPTSIHNILVNKSAQIEQSVREVQALEGRVEKLETFYDDMMLENAHILGLLDYDISLGKEE